MRKNFERLLALPYLCSKGTVEFLLNLKQSITIVDYEILNSDYVSYIAIIDDTAMTNMYGFPLEAENIRFNWIQEIGYILSFLPKMNDALPLLLFSPKCFLK